MDDYMLTTYDNPFNPFTEFEAWYKEDRLLGYDTCGLLARTSNVSDEVSQEIYDKEVDAAMDYIVSVFPLIFKKVKREDYEKMAS